MIRIVADSTCDLPKELVEKYKVSIVPLHIVLKDKEYKDGVEIKPDDIYKWSNENNTTPTTSAASIDDVINVFKTIIEAGDEIIAISISEELSVTANVFRMAAEELDVSDKVSVINSLNITMGTSLLIVEAASMALEGKSREEIVSKIESLRERVSTSFVVDTLTFLHRGGRCSGVAALAGGILKLHPKIVVENGKLLPSKKYRGKMESVIINYVKDLEEDLKNADSKIAFLVHSGENEEIVEQIYKYLKDLNHFENIYVGQAGGVISSHCGPKALGVIFIR